MSACVYFGAFWVYFCCFFAKKVLYLDYILIYLFIFLKMNENNNYLPPLPLPSVPARVIEGVGRRMQSQQYYDAQQLIKTFSNR